MRLRAIASLLLCCHVCQIPLFSRQITSTNTSLPQRDPQALTVVNKALAAAGGAQTLSAITDFTASGNITYFWAGEQVQGSVSLKGRGTTEFREDIVLPQGTRTIKAVGFAGSITTEDGHSRAIPYSELLTIGSLTFPALRIASLVNSSGTALQYVGLVSTAVGQAHQIHVIPPP